MSIDVAPRAPVWKIAVLSALILTLELALIRQVPAEVRVISYFTNLLLMAAFFGFGLGCLLQPVRNLGLLLPVGLVGIWGFVAFARGLVIYEEATAVHYWLQYEQVSEQARVVPIAAAAAAAFLTAATPFVALGQELARRMSEHPRLVAYGWDIAGSLAGVAVFTLASYAGVPPWIWPPAIGVTWALLFAGGGIARLASIGAGLSFLYFAHTAYEAQWSPYYLVQYAQKPFGLTVFVNSSPHQMAVNFTVDEPEGNSLRKSVLDKFSAPYQIYRDLHGGKSPEQVLILGAGTGNDVYVAQQNGARRIVAVEIDPVILELGRRLNSARPYDDPRVTAVVADARQYAKRTRETFDLVLLATLDSQTLLSGHANLRLENYVYTVEAFRDMGALLAPGGMVGAYYSVLRPWLRGRIYATASAAFPGHTQLYWFDSPMLFDTLLMASRDLEAFRSIPEQVEGLSGSIPSTDDWPFLYLERPTIAPVYLQVGAGVLLLVCLAGLIVRRLYYRPGSGPYVDFFLLGLGFTLIESAAVVRMALLFGSTWTVNAMVFSAVLFTVFLANRAVLAGWAPSLRWAWPGATAGLIANWALPVDALLVLPPLAQCLVAAALIGAPVFCASVCFSRLFDRAANVGGAFGMNLIGAMAGGLLEYLSMLIGMRAVWLLAAAIYLGTRLAHRLATPAAAPRAGARCPPPQGVPHPG